MKQLIKALFLLSIFCLGNAPDGTAQFLEAGVQELEVPIPAPDFTLRELSGEAISLKEFRGKVVLLNFFAPWCRVCQREASSLARLNGVIKNEGIVILQVAIKEEKDKLLKFRNKFHISTPILMDEDGSVAKAYGILGHHETFFISPRGMIVGRTFGGIDWTSASMRKLFQHLLREEK